MPIASLGADNYHGTLEKVSTYQQKYEMANFIISGFTIMYNMSVVSAPEKVIFGRYAPPSFYVKLG